MRRRMACCRAVLYFVIPAGNRREDLTFSLRCVSVVKLSAAQYFEHQWSDETGQPLYSEGDS